MEESSEGHTLGTEIERCRIEYIHKRPVTGQRLG